MGEEVEVRAWHGVVGGAWRGLFSPVWVCECERRPCCMLGVEMPLEGEWQGWSSPEGSGDQDGNTGWEEQREWAMIKTNTQAENVLLHQNMDVASDISFSALSSKGGVKHLPGPPPPFTFYPPSKYTENVHSAGYLSV